MENKFSKLGIKDELLLAIEDAKFSEPSEIQEKSIPKILSGKDIIGESATGSGKTLAFGSGIVQNLNKGEGIRALVLTPTRELAEQVSKSLAIFSKRKGLFVTPVYGGVGMSGQIEKMEKADAVVGTPGRILDHLERGNLSLSKIKILVLDEADRMLDMGFIDDIERIINAVNKDRQTLLFSATVSSDIARIAKKYMNKPEVISVNNAVDPKKLAQVYYDVSDKEKISLLVHLIKSEKSKLSMVFCNTQHMTDFVAKNLRKNKIDAVSIHGGLSQNRRNSVMNDFHSGKYYVLVCTDVAARGLDIKNVSHVYNYDIPKEKENYIHRIGRTARAGKDGIAISLLGSRDYELFSKIQNRVATVKRSDTPKFEKVFVIRSEKRGHLRDGDRNNFNRRGSYTQNRNFRRR